MATIEREVREKGEATMVETEEVLWIMLHADDAGIVLRSPESLKKMVSTSCAFPARSD